MQEGNQPSTHEEKITKRDYWRGQVERWKESALSQEMYCKEAGINYNTFIYWRGIFLAETQAKPVKSKFTPVRVTATHPMVSNGSGVIQIKLISGHHVYLPDTMGITNIISLIQALGVHHD
jgi:hypothetical protein